MSKRLIQPFRRKILAASSLAALSPGLSAQTPSYPSRPVRFVVPITTGGSNGQATRVFPAHRLAPSFACAVWRTGHVLRPSVVRVACVARPQGLG